MTLPLYYAPEQINLKHAWDSTRKHGDVVAAIAADPDLAAATRLVRPVPATRAELSAIHSDTYVQAVLSGKPRTVAESQGFRWCKDLYEAVTYSNGGVRDAALDALRQGPGGHAGALVSGFHHARYGRGGGFCTFNGLILAATAALAQGVRRVAILDADRHWGDGTNEMILALSLDGRVRDEHVRGATAPEYMACLDLQLAALLAWEPDLILYQAGADPHQNDALGGVPGMTATQLRLRDRRVFGAARAAGVPLAWTLAGGYGKGSPYTARTAAAKRNPVIELHVNTVREAAALLGKTGG